MPLLALSPTNLIISPNLWVTNLLARCLLVFVQHSRMQLVVIILHSMFCLPVVIQDNQNSIGRLVYFSDKPKETQRKVFGTKKFWEESEPESPIVHSFVVNSFKDNKKEYNSDSEFGKVLHTELEKGNDVLVDDGDEAFHTIWKLLEDSSEENIELDSNKTQAVENDEFFNKTLHRENIDDRIGFPWKELLSILFAILFLVFASYSLSTFVLKRQIGSSGNKYIALLDYRKSLNHSFLTGAAYSYQACSQNSSVTVFTSTDEEGTPTYL